MAEELAMQGGPRTVPAGTVKSWPPVTEEDKEAVLSVFDSNVFHGAAAPQAVALQEEWAEYIGTKYALVTNSGTSALHMAIASVGVEAGDEVITTAFTFWSTAAAVLHHNAIPIFVDIEPKTFSIDPAKIEEKITDRTKALLPVHIHGMPVDMDPIMEIAKKHDLTVVSDACQAHGSKYNGRKIGSIAHTAGFSLNRSKNLSGGEGGLFNTDNEEFYRHAEKIRQFGEVVLKDHEREYNAFGLGWNYRQHEFINAFVRSQLTRLDEYNAKRIEMAEFLHEKLAQIPGVEPPYCPPEREPVYFSYVVEFRPDQLGLDVDAETLKTAAQKALAAEGVGLGQWQKMPVPAQSVFQEKTGYGKGCPWNCQHGRDVEYRAEDYPETIEFIASHSYLSGVFPPNDMPLMELYVEGFKKVMDRAKDIVSPVGK